MVDAPSASAGRTRGQCPDTIRKVRMVVFDLDGTLIRGRSSWGRVHEFFGTEHKGSIALAKYERGEIGYEEFMRRDVSAWPPGISVSVLEKILSDFTFTDGARECVRGLKARGIGMGVVSSGLDILAKLVCDRLGIDSFVANGLELDGQRRLTGGVVPRVDLFKKDEVLRRIAGNNGLEPEEILGVGDTRFDMMFLKACGYRVAFRPREADRRALEEVAHYLIDDLRELLPIVDTINLPSAGEGK